MFSVSLIQVYNEKSLKSFELRLSVLTSGRRGRKYIEYLQ